MFRSRGRSWIPPARQWAGLAWEHHPDGIDWIGTPICLFLAWWLLDWNAALCVAIGLAGLVVGPFARGWWDWHRSGGAR